MPLKDILVLLDDSKVNAERITMAFDLAKLNGSKVTAAALGSMKPIHAPETDDKASARMAQKMADQLVSDFMTKAEANGIIARTLIIHGIASDSSEKMAHYARNHDLVVLAQPNPSQSNYVWMQDFAEDVLLLSGRPVMFMPYIGVRKTSIDKVIIAWDGTPAVSRAVHDSIPILLGAEDVVILIVESKKQQTFKQDVLVDGLLEHLLYHGAKARISRVNPGNNDVPTVILNQISDNNIDLLIMGGYGTPTLKQKIFGSVSATMLSCMTTSVLMSH